MGLLDTEESQQHTEHMKMTWRQPNPISGAAQEEAKVRSASSIAHERARLKDPLRHLRSTPWRQGGTRQRTGRPVARLRGSNSFLLLVAGRGQIHGHAMDPN